MIENEGIGSRAEPDESELICKCVLRDDAIYEAGYNAGMAVRGVSEARKYIDIIIACWLLSGFAPFVAFVIYDIISGPM